MARLWTCGFELNSATAGVEFDTVTGTAVAIDATVINGGLYSLHPSTTAAVTSYVTHQFDSGSASHDIYFRTYFRHDVRPDANTAILLMRDTGGAVTVWTVQITSTGTLRFLDDSNTLIGTTAALNTSQWYRIEVKYTFTGGNLELKLDGVSTLTGVGFSTALSGNQIRIGRQTAGTSANPSFYFDDVAVNDTTGTAQTGYPGAGKVVHLYPNAAGDNTQWQDSASGTQGTSTSGAVDETTPNDATDYNKRTTNSPTTTPVDDFNLPASSTVSIGASDTINVVEVGFRGGAISTTSTARSIKTRLKSAASGTTTSSASIPVNVNGWTTNAAAAPKVAKLVSYTDPTTTVAWTATGTNSIDNAQIGYQADVSSANEIRVTTVWMVVDFAVAGGGTAYTSSLTGSLSFVGSQSKSTAHKMTATLSFVGAFTKATRRSLVATLSFVGSLVKNLRRSLTGTLSFVGTFVASHLFFQALTATLSFVGTFSKRTSKPLAGTLSFTGNLAKAMTRVLTATLSFVGSMTKRTARAVTGTLSFVGAFVTGALHFQALTATLSFTGSISKSISHKMTATLSFSGSLPKRLSRALSATLSFTGNFTKSIAKSFTAALSFSGLLSSIHSRAPSVLRSLTVTIHGFTNLVSGRGGTSATGDKGASNLETLAGGDTIGEISGQINTDTLNNPPNQTEIE